jgi:DNA-binding Xre family transcriptional regulator
MLHFNVMRVMNLRGIHQPWVFMVKNGFIRSTANNFYNGNVKEIKVEHIEKLCLLLNCTPSDLFEWHSDETSPALTENQALKSLIREKSAPTITEIVRDLPIEKMEEIGKLLDRIKEKE